MLLISDDIPARTEYFGLESLNPLKPDQIDLNSFKNIGRRLWATKEEMTQKICKKLIKRKKKLQKRKKEG